MLNGIAGYWANIATPFLIISPGAPHAGNAGHQCCQPLSPTTILGIRRPPGNIARMIDETYLWILRISLRHRWAIVVLSIVMLFSTPVVFGWIGKEFVPKDDQSDLEVVMTLPEGYTLDRGNILLLEIEECLKQRRGVTHVFTIIGDTTGRVAKGQGDVTEARV